LEQIGNGGALHIYYGMLIPNQVKDSFAILAVGKSKFLSFTGVHGVGYGKTRWFYQRSPGDFPAKFSYADDV